MEFNKVLHNNEWIDVNSLNVVSVSEKNNTFLINNTFNLQSRDKIKFRCFNCGIESISVFKFRNKFFQSQIKCKKCEVNEKRKQTWLEKYGVDHVMKSNEYRKKQSIYFSQNPTKGFQGHKHKKEAKEKLSKANIGNKKACGKRTKKQKENISIATKSALRDPIKRKKISDGLKGNKNAVGHVFNEKSKQEMTKKVRIKYINRINENREKGFQIVPFWNPKACDYFEQFDKDNNTQGQHARNEGEFHIKELGYWVDYINHDLKLIMEYDEKYHNSLKQKEKDEIRQNEIQELYPNYEFRRINDEF